MYLLAVAPSIGCSRSYASRAFCIAVSVIGGGGTLAPSGEGAPGGAGGPAPGGGNRMWTVLSGQKLAVEPSLNSIDHEPLAWTVAPGIGGPNGLLSVACAAAAGGRLLIGLFNTP